MTYPQQPFGPVQPQGQFDPQFQQQPQYAPQPQAPQQYQPYAPAGAPQQQYAPAGYQPQQYAPQPQAPQQQLAQGGLADFYNQPVTGAGKSVNLAVGQWMPVRFPNAITDRNVQQQTMPAAAGGAPKFFKDGRPMWMLVMPVVDLTTGEPMQLYVKGQLHEEMAAKIRAAGVPGEPLPEAGSSAWIGVTGSRPTGFGSPAKIWEVHYYRPGEELPAQPPVGQQRQAAPAPQAPPQSAPQQAFQQGLQQHAAMTQGAPDPYGTAQQFAPPAPQGTGPQPMPTAPAPQQPQYSSQQWTQANAALQQAQPAPAPQQANGFQRPPGMTDEQWAQYAPLLGAAAQQG